MNGDVIKRILIGSKSIRFIAFVSLAGAICVICGGIGKR